MNVRLLALGAVATCALVLPLAAASAGPVGGGGEAVRSVARAVVHQPSYDDGAAGHAAGGGRPYEHRTDDGSANGPTDTRAVDGRPADGGARDGADGDAKGPAADASSPARSDSASPRPPAAVRNCPPRKASRRRPAC